MKQYQKDGEWFWEFSEKEDNKIYHSLLDLADKLGVDPESKDFSDHFNRVLLKQIKILEKQSTCDHDWQCVWPGMTVSHYTCKHCGKEELRAD